MKNEFIPKDTEVVIDEDSISPEVRKNIIRNVQGNWIFGNTMRVVRDFSPEDYLVECEVKRPEGRVVTTSWYPENIKLAKTKEEIKQELLVLREEIYD